MKKPATIDYETQEILKRPEYPPVPVGVAINEPGKRSKYMAWGHPTHNNCTREEARKELRRLYDHYPILAHNAKFDLEIGEKHFGLPLIPPHGFEDSMLLAFLRNPRERNLKLKPLSDRWLGFPPDEQAELREWILEHVREARRQKTNWGRFICLAPGRLVGRYAKGDVDRTRKLYDAFMPYIKAKGMTKQYELEKRVIIESIYMERTGIMLDVPRLEPDLAQAEKEMAKHERAIYRKLGDINLGSPQQKVAAFEAAGLVDEWEYTDKGNPKTGIDSLMRVCKDRRLVRHLDLYSKYTKLIGTYMRPWLRSALENGGRFYPWFNTIRGDNDHGTYTGRFSSNFQQVPREPQAEYKSLPFLRNYIIPDKKTHLLYNRDFSQQELRILAHFTEGDLLEAYLKFHDTDIHNYVKEEIQARTGIEYPRAYVKGCNFLIVYGGGPNALSALLGITADEAREIFKTYYETLPEIRELADELIVHTRHGEQFKTAGGRWYDPDEGFEYKTLNTLIQGSAADHMKRALVNISDVLRDVPTLNEARIMLTVHDEFMVSGPRKLRRRLMSAFKEAMEYDELFDLPMLSEGKIGERWGEMKKVA